MTYTFNDNQKRTFACIADKFKKKFYGKYSLLLDSAKPYDIGKTGDVDVGVSANRSANNTDFEEMIGNGRIALDAKGNLAGTAGAGPDGLTIHQDIHGAAYACTPSYQEYLKQIEEDRRNGKLRGQKPLMPSS